MTGGKPSFKLNMDGLGGALPAGATPKEQMLSGMGATGITPSGMRPGMPNMDQMSLASPSAMSVSEMSSRFRAKMKAGGIPTPLGSDMSRAKFDFSGYDPKKFRKQKEKSPERKVIKKEEGDMEVFVSDFGSNPEKVDLERKNDESSVNVRKQVVNDIFDTRKDSHMDKSTKQQRLLDIQNF